MGQSQGRLPNTDGALECDISGGVTQQTSKHNEGTGELNPPTHGPSDLSCLLQKYSLSESDIEKRCDDELFLTLSSKISNFKDTAPYFGFTQAEIEEIRIDESKERSRKLTLLWNWRSRNGSDATYLAIVEVFLRMNDRNLAEIVLQHVKGMLQHQPQPIRSYVYPERVNSYVNWEKKSAAEKEQIKNRLYNQNQHIRKKYSFLIQNILDSFEKRNINVQRLKMFLDTYGSMPLSKLESASSLIDVFSVLCRYYSSWFNIRLLKAIVKQFGSDEDRKKMKVYKDELLVYLQRSLFEIPSKSFAPGHENVGLIPLFLLLPNDTVPTGEDVKNITRNLSQLLGISDGILQFLGFEDCSILLIFGVPEQLLHINALQRVIEKYFTYDITRKGYTINDLALILPPGLNDKVSALKKSQIQPTESIVTENVTLATSTEKLKDSQGTKESKTKADKSPYTTLINEMEREERMREERMEREERMREERMEVWEMMERMMERMNMEMNVNMEVNVDVERNVDVEEEMMVEMDLPASKVDEKPLTSENLRAPVKKPEQQ